MQYTLEPLGILLLFYTIYCLVDSDTKFEVIRAAVIGAISILLLIVSTFI